MVGDRITFDLLMNFSDDPTVGGGVDIHYDPAYLEFVRFDFDSDFRGDPFYNRQPIVIPGGVLSSLSFGDFNGVSIGKVGMFTFQALERGTSHITLLSDGLPGDLHLVAGRFFSAVSFSEQAVSFSGATVTVVPEPEIWGMLLAGIGLIGWWARSQRARRAPAPVAPG